MSYAIYRRACGHDHKFPLCACREGLYGKSLRARSLQLSRLAGWPGPVTEAMAEATVALHGGPTVAVEEDPGDVPPDWWPEGLSFGLLRGARPPEGDCGCGQGRA